LKSTSGRRLLGGLFAVATAVAGVTTPAFAAPAPTFALSLAGQSLAPGTNIFFAAGVTSTQPVEVSALQVTFQLSADLTGVSVTSEDGVSGCVSASPTKLVCDLNPNGPPVDPTSLPLGAELSAAAAAVVGAAGTLTMTAQSSGFAPITRTVPVHVAEGVNLTSLNPIRTAVDVGAAGDTFATTLSVRNSGPVAAHGAAFVVASPFAVEAGPTRYRNCFYRAGQMRACAFDQELALGAAYTVTVPQAVRSDTFAPSDLGLTYTWQTPDQLDDAALGLAGGFGQAGDGPALVLTPVATTALARQVDTGRTDNLVDFDVHVGGANGVDLAAIGGTVTGRVGDVVTAQVGLRNNGPATIDMSGLFDLGSGTPSQPVPGYAALVVVTPPKGTTVVSAPKGCAASTGGGFYDDASAPFRAGAESYRCPALPLFLTGRSQTFAFGLRITAIVAGAAGQVAVPIERGPCECLIFDRAGDLNKANDTAPIMVKPSRSPADQARAAAALAAARTAAARTAAACRSLARTARPSAAPAC
jgi:hypothetical protein